MIKRILHVGGSMSIGGAERALYQLISSQCKNRDIADLITTSATELYSKKVSEIGANVFEIKQRHSFDMTCVNSFLKLAKNYDILHFHYPNPALMFACFILPKSKKLFYTHRAGKHVYPLNRKIVYQAAGFCIRNKFTGVSGNTDFAAATAAEIFRLDKNRIPTTYNGINFDLLLPKRNRKDILDELGESENSKFVRIGTTGNFRKLKRVDYLLRAISDLKSENVMCYAIGDGPEMPHLKSMAEKLGVEDIMRFPGKKKHVGDYLQLFDIFVLPSDCSESFGNSAVEAMGLGIPTVVMRDGGGLIEHIADGCGFIADNVDHLSKILNVLITSKDLRIRIGDAGKVYVRNKYSYENMIAGYNRLYNMGSN